MLAELIHMGEEDHSSLMVILVRVTIQNDDLSCVTLGPNIKWAVRRPSSASIGTKNFASSHSEGNNVKLHISAT